jgi:serine-type D-Ala-D-Ala carboxypeptidase
VRAWGPVHEVLTRACADRVFPGAAAEVGTSAGVLWRTAVGVTSHEEPAAPVDACTIYDLASLTKVIATTTVALRLFDAGRLPLDRRVSEVVPAWTGDDRSSVTIADLLEHTSGLPEWRPLFRSARGREAFVSAVVTTPLAYPPRARSLYSDLGFMLLGWVLEAVAGAPLDALTTSALADGVGQDVADGLRFGAPPDWWTRLAPTTTQDERGTLRPGDVDDTNAWALGGVAGHAGMFGAIAPAGAFGGAMLRAARGGTTGPHVLASLSGVSRFLRRSGVAGSSRALGWDLMLPTSSCGSRMSEAAFGHTGFTGTSLWIDPSADAYCVLLSNRVHPRAGGPEGIRIVRRAFHDAVMNTL